MSEKQAKLITIDDKEYDTATFTEEQVLLTNHCLDLDRKIGSAQFQLQQLQIGKEAFLKMLKESLEQEQEPETVQ
jgi:hypothetical protein